MRYLLAPFAFVLSAVAAGLILIVMLGIVGALKVEELLRGEWLAVRRYLVWR